MLITIKEFFGVGRVTNPSAGMIYYQVQDRNELLVIINHFIAYPLQSTKWIYFMLFRKVYYMLESGVHFTRTGFIAILNIKAVFKKGLSTDLLSAYPEVIPIALPIFTPSSDTLHPEWIAGFVSGDGSFGLNYSKSQGHKLKYSCRPQFRIFQDQRDLSLLNRIIAQLGGTIIEPSKDRTVYSVVIGDLPTLAGSIVNFFNTYNIIGSKA